MHTTNSFLKTVGFFLIINTICSASLNAMNPVDKEKLDQRRIDEFFKNSDEHKKLTDEEKKKLLEDAASFLKVELSNEEDQEQEEAVFRLKKKTKGGGKPLSQEELDHYFDKVGVLFEKCPDEIAEALINAEKRKLIYDLIVFLHGGSVNDEGIARSFK